MAAITINIPDDQLQKLQAMAQESGVSPEDLLRATIENWLNHSNSDFVQAASYVLNKNAELYRRLA
ncbi:Ribbon-helix-helix protein, copG family [Cylindrospermum stagnale PCC 7417]|uniref:Ribbon-helix-helix protein, copG family n=1 Tax=Cylindrospermum stagnale PCC 7417 TaxID=56107 RepID=K9X8B4_9NOST|nr:ribbon-helix-helix domain-containing protein [Cylindrospermum stagnale]AFZ27902.1 Ribbon-helix-helix protein, copG family [Cylindrospermum stagnale PCC 7417]